MNLEKMKRADLIAELRRTARVVRAADHYAKLMAKPDGGTLEQYDREEQASGRPLAAAAETKPRTTKKRKG